MTEITLGFHIDNINNLMADQDNNVNNPPSSSGKSVYPYNNSTTTRSGHVFETDDSLGNERIYRKHKSGSYELYGPDGALTHVVVNDRFVVVIEDDNVTIHGDSNVTVGGDCNLTVKGNLNQNVEGDYNLNVVGDFRTKVKGARFSEIDGDEAISSRGNIRHMCQQGTMTQRFKDQDTVITNDMGVTVTNDMTFIVSGDAGLMSKNTFSIGAGTTMKLGSTTCKIGAKDMEIGITDHSQWTTNTLTADVEGLSRFNIGTFDINVDDNYTLDATLTTVTTDNSYYNTGTFGISVTNRSYSHGGSGFHVDNDITTDSDVIAGSVSLENHTHGGVQGGSSSTAPPN